MSAPPSARPSALAAIQEGLERLYRINTNLDIHDFLVSKEERDHYHKGRAPREQLLLREHDEGVDLALYVEQEALLALERHDPREGLSEHNLEELLLVLEGVSHFIYAVDRARRQWPISALELELQAEVDKYVTLVLLSFEYGQPPARDAFLIDRLFHNVVYDPHLSPEEHSRYTTANDRAKEYAKGLLRKYLVRGALLPFLTDVRRFWHLSYSGKVSHITSTQ